MDRIDRPFFFFFSLLASYLKIKKMMVKKGKGFAHGYVMKRGYRGETSFADLSWRHLWCGVGIA
jgi:hypothetical protein